MRKHWKKGLLALVVLVALIFMLSTMACGGSEGTSKLSPFQTLNNTVVSHTTKIEKNKSDITTLNTGVAQLRTDLDAVVAGLPALPDYSANFTAIQVQINSLKASDNATQMVIDGISGKVDTMKTSVATMQLYIDAVMDNFNTLSYRVDAIETALNLSP